MPTYSLLVNNRQVSVDADEDPEGMGEMTLPPLAAALSNAVFVATGKRIHKLPIQLTDRPTT